jgi:Ala-tRNA(Pro) deacylase
MEQYFRENGVSFEVLKHDQAYTMQEAAAALHVSGKQVAKVVILKADKGMAMLVISAPDRVNLDHVRAALDAKKVSLAKENEFASLFPDCAPGAMPPFGNLYDVPVYVDRALADKEHIIFRVGTHRHTMRIAYADFERLAQPTVGEFAYLV